MKKKKQHGVILPYKINKHYSTRRLLVVVAQTTSVFELHALLVLLVKMPPDHLSVARAFNLKLLL